MSASERQAEEEKHNDEKEKQINIVLEHYGGQWPCSIPQAPGATNASLLNIKAASTEIRTLFAHWTKNGEFHNYIGNAQSILDRMYEDLPTHSYRADDWQTWQAHSRLDAASLLPTLQHMLMSVAPPQLFRTPEVMTLESTSQASDFNPKLHDLVKGLGEKRGKSSVRKQYSDELVASLDAFYKRKERLVPNIMPCSLEDLLINRIDCEKHVMEIFDAIYDSLRPKDRISGILDAGALWPRLTVRSVIKHLLNLSEAHFHWKYRLLVLGEAITILQRARRLVLAGERNDVPSLCAELENVGRIGWGSDIWPEWLLIEIENDFLIRPNQVQVALQMLNPSSSSNSLTQLNMVQSTELPTYAAC